MKKVVHSILLFSLIGISIIRCQKKSVDSNVSALNTLDEYAISNLIKIVPIEKRILNINSKKPIIIVQWDEWGRKKIDCKGWGLCKAEWFPKEQLYKKYANGIASILEFDSSKNQYFIDLFLAEKLPNKIDLSSISLKIDENFQLQNNSFIVLNNLTFSKGEYPFNSNLGVFGGYRIYLN